MLDPSELTVKEVRGLISDLDISGLEETLKAEIDGRHRSSLIAELGRAIDAKKTEDEEEAETEAEPEEELEEAEPAVVTVAEAPARRVLDERAWFKLSRDSRRHWVRRSDGRYEAR